MRHVFALASSLIVAVFTQKGPRHWKHYSICSLVCWDKKKRERERSDQQTTTQWREKATGTTERQTHKLQTPFVSATVPPFANGELMKLGQNVFVHYAAISNYIPEVPCISAIGKHWPFTQGHKDKWDSSECEYPMCYQMAKKERNYELKRWNYDRRWQHLRLRCCDIMILYNRVCQKQLCPVV